MMELNIIANLCIYILTWNVGAHYPDDVSLTNALSLNGTNLCPNNQRPDIYVVALQEVNTTLKNQVLSIFQDNLWTFKVKDYLQEYDYVKVETEQMQGLLIMLFAQPHHIDHMRDIESQSTRTGFGGLWGNKGAVSIRMSLYGTGVTFIGAHLAAHDNKLKERIEDYNQIVDNHHYKQKRYGSIFDHDVVFWFGDLNFRLTGEESAWDIRSLVENNQLTELIQQDQLLMVRETGNAFAPMEENLPTFPPTFKFFEGTSDYNLKRRPAWCDRILYRVERNKYPGIKLSVEQLSYVSHSEYTLSDHKPVSSQFLYTIETDLAQADELHDMTHKNSAETPLASVIILRLVCYLIFLNMIQ